MKEEWLDLKSYKGPTVCPRVPKMVWEEQVGG